LSPPQEILAPDDVGRAASSIPLEDKDTRPFGISRGLLVEDRGLDTIDHLAGKDIVLDELIVAMGGDRSA